jgi:hypothetical protein
MLCSGIGLMTSKVVCVTSPGQVGATFLDWSLHWLTGHRKVYNTQQQAWTPLTDSPIDKNNAHNHLKNHPSGHGRFLNTVTELQQTHSKTFHTCYPAPLLFDEIALQLGFNEQKIKDPKIWQYVVTTCNLDYAHIFQSCNEHNIPVIYLAANTHTPVYHGLSLNRARVPLTVGGDIDYIDDQYLSVHQWFFNNEMQHVSTRWDQREVLALNLQIDNYNLNDDMIDFSNPHLWINCEELWHDGEYVVRQCLDYINEPLIEMQLESWKAVYQQWQQIQQQILKFCYELDHIVDATVKGWYYPLRPLTLLQEAIIQHRLIYQHNLNIRNWQLETFPDNTNKLHILLETNQHATRTTS